MVHALPEPLTSLFCPRKCGAMTSHSWMWPFLASLCLLMNRARTWQLVVAKINMIIIMGSRDNLWRQTLAVNAVNGTRVTWTTRQAKLSILAKEAWCYRAGGSSAAGTASAVPVFLEKMVDDISIRLVNWGRQRFVSASWPPRVHTISKRSLRTMYEWFPLVSTSHVKNSSSIIR